MNLNNFNFDKDYKAFINFLYSIHDEEYKNFHFKLLKNESINLIGIRTPILKNIAKEIAKNNYESFIKNNTHKTYEEVMLHGLVIGYLKVPFKEVLAHLNNFMQYNNNWAINDIICANLKCFKNNLDEGYIYIKQLIHSNNEWKIRFGLVLLLNYYISDKYIEDIYKICNSINNECYYVKMAIAWLLSICFIKYQDKTHIFLINNDLDNFTFNKTISKICDSYRVDKKTKDNLKKLRRK